MALLTDKRAGTQTGLLFLFGLVVLDIFALVIMTTQRIGPITFCMSMLLLGSLPLFGLIAYQLVGLSRSGYDVDRNAVIIQWGDIRQVVPLEAVQRIMLGAEVEGGLTHFRGWRWPGLMHGQAEVPEAGPTLFYATTPFYQQLIIVTPALSYAISPIDVAGFIESIKARYELGPTQAVEQTTEHPAIYNWPLWHDRMARGLIVAGFVLFVALFGLVTFRYPQLPPVIPLHFTASGMPDRSGPATQIFILPLIGVLSIVGNTLLGGVFYRREQMASYLLWGGTVLVQVLLWISAMNLLRIG